MLDIRKFKVRRYVFLLISAVFLLHCDPLPTDPGTLPPSNLKFDKTDFFVYVGDDVIIKPTVSNNVDEFTIAPVLPIGLSIDTKTGIISGISASASDSTKYTMFATNKNGSVKAEFSLTISSYPYFVIQPQTQTATIGGSVSFTASAKGSAPLTYNWTKDGVALSDTGKTLRLVDIKATSAGLYRCIVQDRRAKMVSSDPAYCLITEIESAPKITLAPGSRSALEGEAVILTSSAIGSNLDYKWLFNGAVIPGATASYLSIESVKATDTGNYVLIVSNKFGSDTSKPAAHLSIVAKTSSNYNFDISIIGKGSVVINNQKYIKDTTLKFFEGTTFTAALIADSGSVLSSVFVDNSLNADAISDKQYLVSNISQNHSINVSFTKLTGTTPDSLFLISGVTDTATGKIETLPNREKFAFNETVTLTAKPAAGYTFAGWSGSILGINISTDIISFNMDTDRSIMATFVRKGRFTLVKTIEPAQGGTIKVSPDSVDYAAGTKVSFQAVPAAGYKFKSWGGASTSLKDTFSLVMDTNKTIVAEFEKIQIGKKETLSVVISIPDTNSGSVVIAPVKLAYVTGDTIQLIAMPKSGFDFTKWSGVPTGVDSLNDTISIILASNCALAPQFIPKSKFTITQTISPAASGEIILVPSQPYYSKGDKVKFTAKAASGFKFTGWSGASTSLVDTITLSVDTSIAIQANFEATRFPLQCVVNPVGSGSVSKSDTLLNVTDTLTISAIPNTVNGYEFKVWRQTGGTGVLYISDSASVSPRVAVSKGPVTLTAIFSLRSTYTVTVNDVVTNGSIIINPVKQAYYTGDTITVTARPEIGYTFTSWIGDLTGTALSQKVTITKSISFNAVFTIGATIQEVPVVAGSSLNAEIKKVSALSIPGAILTPAAGKYDNNTIEILGKVTLPIQRR